MKLTSNSAMASCLFITAGTVKTKDNLNTILFTTDHRRPHFQSVQESFEIKVGDDVTFPCLVNHKGTFRNTGCPLYFN